AGTTRTPHALALADQFRMRARTGAKSHHGAGRVRVDSRQSRTRRTGPPRGAPVGKVTNGSKSAMRNRCSILIVASGRERQGLEFLASGPEASKLVDRRSCRGKRERLEWFRKHLVQVGFGGDTDRDMRIELRTGCNHHEISNILQQERLYSAPV